MKVKCIDNEREKRLEKNQTYEAYKVVISGFHTEVFLNEFPGEVFNSVCFDEKFQKELKKAINYFRKDEYAYTYGIFVKDF